jgi:hypothetical protein
MQVIDLAPGQLFMWNSSLYEVISHDDDAYTTVREIACRENEGWGTNKRSIKRGDTEVFNGYCIVTVTF